MLGLKRGVAIKNTKKSAGIKIITADIPNELVIPLRQHIGKEAKAVVKKGDYVKKYQLIGEADGNISANIHASSSGEVIAVEKRPTALGNIDCVVLKTDKKDFGEGFCTSGSNIDTIRTAGIVGMGGACFPTHFKLKSGSSCDTFILNGCECEPYLTGDLRVMIENGQEVIEGFKILMKTAGINKGIIGVESKKAYESLKEIVDLHDDIEIRLLKAKYPQGAEKMLIYSLTGKIVPCGKLPGDVGVIVNNVSTAKAVYDALNGIPLVERVVTVSGQTNNPRNLLVRVGTKFSDLIQENYEKVIAGGPMMGTAISDLNVPVTKGNGGITLMKEDKTSYENCIRCSSCIEACPMNLMPARLANYSALGMYDKAGEFYLNDCFECGTCAYVCPCRIPIVQLIKTAKHEVKNADK